MREILSQLLVPFTNLLCVTLFVLWLLSAWFLSNLKFEVTITKSKVTTSFRCIASIIFQRSKYLLFRRIWYLHKYNYVPQLYKGAQPLREHRIPDDVSSGVVGKARVLSDPLGCSRLVLRTQVTSWFRFSPPASTATHGR